MTDGLSFYETVGRRRSVRRFSDRPVEGEKLRRIMDVGRRAASAANRQPWKFFLLLGEGRGPFGVLLKECFREAPAMIVACAFPGEAWVRRQDDRNYAWVDVSIAVTEMVLAATAEGLGTCWVASFDPAAAGKALGLESGCEPVTAVALGYGAEPVTDTKKKRKAAGEVWEIRGNS